MTGDTLVSQQRLDIFHVFHVRRAQRSGQNKRQQSDACESRVLPDIPVTGDGGNTANRRGHNRFGVQDERHHLRSKLNWFFSESSITVWLKPLVWRPFIVVSRRHRGNAGGVAVLI